MAKQFRKAKRRPSREHQDAVEENKKDADLDELWDVLAETKQQDSWDVPWRDGTNAARLAVQLVRLSSKSWQGLSGEDLRIADEIFEWIDYAYGRRGSIDQEWYWKFQEHLSGMDKGFLRVSLRCAQLVIANSHGGGHGFNELFKPLLDAFPDGADALVRDARCQDALELDPTFDQNPKRDRLRRAFFTAWDRGLYQVAYAVGA